MADTRKRNNSWVIATNADGTTPSSHAGLAVLMDIRDELQTLVTIFQCSNFQQMPWDLKRLVKNTSKPKKKRTAIRRAA